MIVDARGQLCPQPVIMTKQAIDQGETTLKIIVDNKIAQENVSRFLTSQGWTFTSTEKDEDFVFVASKDQQLAVDQLAQAAEMPALLITHKELGGTDQELGEALMKTLCSTLSQLDQAPKLICFMNEGVKLTIKGSGTADALLELENKDCEILVCGACLKHFQLEGQNIGKVSNMFEIFEKLLSCRTLTL